MDILELIEQREGIREKKENNQKKTTNKKMETEDVFYKSSLLRFSSSDESFERSNLKKVSSKVLVKRR